MWSQSAPVPTLRHPCGKEQGPISGSAVSVGSAKFAVYLPLDTNLYSSGSKLPAQLDSYNPYHLLEERTGTPLTARRGHLEASLRAILEFACDIHCVSPSRVTTSQKDLGGVARGVFNFHNCFRPLRLWRLFSLFKLTFFRSL